MSLFLTIMLSVFVALFLIVCVLAILMTVAIIEYKKKQKNDLQACFDSFNVNRESD